MVARLARLLLRMVGWALTPLIIVAAAAGGAMTVALLGGRLSATAAIVAMGGGALIAALLASWGWLRVLRRFGRLRTALHVTPEGVPTDAALRDVIGTDQETLGQ